jgi:hypothetical protein
MVFSAFAVGAALDIAGFIAGIAIVGFAAFALVRGLRRPRSASNR